MKNDKSSNQGRRLILLRDFLLTHTNKDHYVSMQQIKDFLDDNYVGVEDRRTIYNAFDILAVDFNLQIEYDRHKNGYHVLNPDFEPSELRLMIDSVQSANFITENEASAITEKIKNLSDIYTRPTLNRKSYVDNRIRNMKESVVNATDIIYQAIAADNQIEFKFYHYTPDYKNPKKYSKNGAYYTVSPFALYWNNGFYYLYAYLSDKQEFRFFRIDRMEKISPHIGMRREGKEEFKAANLTTKRKAKIFDMYRGKEYLVRLRCQNRIADYIIDKFGKDTMLIPEDDKHFTADVFVEISPPFFAWVSTFGKSIKIVSPQPVIDEMKMFIRKVSEMYEDEGEM